ncbi:PAS domain-containing sensor histidine kinase [Spirosoma linguale]|uniref:histidine kinase n=1 Tax=Spirosoma linguale (strain ATCC 33905 / DSM 74 / LMG 10896 / Claus 1) TaxID=504472 RepID=D2QPZ0_SPILD|nr:histidine kinase [Spirosoma linguale DSM 74]
MNVVNAISHQDMSLSAALIELSQDGILVLASEQPTVSGFQVIQANARALSLLSGLKKPLVGTPVDQLPAPFTSHYLGAYIDQALNQATPVRFQLLHSFFTTSSVTIYECQLLNVDSQRLILSIGLLQVPPERSQLLEQVIESMPTGLVMFQALRDTNQTIVDFQAILCNQLGADISRQSKETILTKPISQRYPNMRAEELFYRYKDVVTTGQRHQDLVYLQPQDIWLDVSVVKYGDGLLVSFQDVTQRQKAASLLESVLRSSPASIRYYESIRDHTGRIVDFKISTGNELDAYQRYRPSQSITGKRLLELYPSVADNGLFDRFVAVVESGKSDHFERFHPLETHGVWFDCVAVQHGDGLVLTTLDITYRKEAQLDQQRQATVLQTVLDNSLTGITLLKTVYNTAGTIVDFSLEKINATLAQTLKQLPERLVGKTLSEFIPHQMSNGLFERYAAVARTGEAQRFVWSNSTDTVWYDMSVVPCFDGLIVTLMDITAIKLAQLDQERQADLLKGVLNSSTTSILVLEPHRDDAGQIADFAINLANPATIRLFFPFVNRDFTQEELQSQSLLTVFPAVKERALFSALVLVVMTGQSIHESVDYPTMGLTYEYDIRPFRGGVLLITTDITPLRVYQQQLEAKNVALSRSNEYLQQFAYVASHDLQEPLRKIHSFGDMLLTQHATALDATGQDLLRRQQNAVLRMQLLIKNLLDYSRLTTQQKPFVSVSLQTITQEILSDLEMRIQETKAHITITELPTIRGDATQLRQLIQNLITNALKFTKPDQPPQIRLDAILLTADQLPATEFTQEQGQWVALRIVDEGIGFNEHYRERIFELFHRLHGRSQYTGTGIGLAVVKKVIENHHGFITTHSQPGEGATFTVYLPMT